jgi:hypothetical protein
VKPALGGGSSPKPQATERAIEARRTETRCFFCTFVTPMRSHNSPVVKTPRRSSAKALVILAARLARIARGIHHGPAFFLTLVVLQLQRINSVSGSFSACGVAARNSPGVKSGDHGTRTSPDLGASPERSCLGLVFRRFVVARPRPAPPRHYHLRNKRVETGSPPNGLRCAT